MTIGILATGDELVHGDTLNTNSYEISQALSSEGLPLGLHLTCSDKEIDIQDSIDFLIKKHDIIIVTGGLGPTSDDRTRFVFEKQFQIKLVEFPDALYHVKHFLSSHRELHAGDKQQALFPPNATIVYNPNGTAMGCHFQINNKLFILLPGPPRECMPMFYLEILPFLKKQQHSNKTIIKWRVFGIPESLIAKQLDTSIASLDCQTGYRYDPPYIELKVRCKPELVSKVRAIVDPIVAPFIISAPEKKASEELVEKIAQLKMPISILDEATGGVLQTLIQRPTTHEYLSFSPIEKAPRHFHITGLQGYWDSEKQQKESKDIKKANELILHYTANQKSEEERKQFSTRSPLILNATAEWLSFRIFNLIDPMH